MQAALASDAVLAMKERTVLRGEWRTQPSRGVSSVQWRVVEAAMSTVHTSERHASIWSRATFHLRLDLMFGWACSLGAASSTRRAVSRR